MLYRLSEELLTLLGRLAILAFRGNAMGHWFHHTVVESGHLPLFCFFLAFAGSFGGIRVAVRLLRARARRRPANTKTSGPHIHHMVYGVVLMVGAGVAGFAVPDRMVAAESATAAVFGVGSALVLDEFALILHFQDVYWSDVGRTSIHAVFVALIKRDPRWRVIHAIPVGDRGSDIDHLVIGPGGVYSLNAKHHPGAKVWVAGNTFMVNGQRQPYLRNSRHESQRASKLLTAATGQQVSVTGVVVPIGADDIVIKQPPVDVVVINRMRLVKWLQARTETLDTVAVEAVFEAARRSTTWRPQ